MTNADLPIEVISLTGFVAMVSRYQDMLLCQEGRHRSTENSGLIDVDGSVELMGTREGPRSDGHGAGCWSGFGELSE